MIHSTAQFSFNRSALPALKVANNAALIADELWKEWSWLDHVADMAGYEDEAKNIAAESARSDYCAFVDAYKDDAYHVPQQVYVTEYDTDTMLDATGRLA